MQTKAPLCQQPTPQLAAPALCPLSVCSQGVTRTCSEHNPESNLQEIIAGRCEPGSLSELKLAICASAHRVSSLLCGLGEGILSHGGQLGSKAGL